MPLQNIQRFLIEFLPSHTTYIRPRPKRLIPLLPLSLPAIPPAMSMFGNNQRAKDDPQYSVLPGGHGPSRLLQGKKRRNLLLALGLLVAGVLVLVWARQPHDVLPSIPSFTAETTLPPLYSDFHRAELALPQHDTRHPFAGGRKYMWVADHAQCELQFFVW